LTLRLAGGAEGYGEAASSFAKAHLKPERLQALLETLSRWAKGRDADDHRPLIAEAWRRCGRAGPAAAAFECALLEALAA
jgi:L-alanine-DL-glutamate epimerase-like enolase superfamily enzyme